MATPMGSFIPKYLLDTPVWLLLSSLSQGPDAVEWNGFSNYLARDQGVLKPANTYVFGPLSDAPPSQPDTILTTLTYMCRSLVDMGMVFVHHYNQRSNLIQLS